MDTLALSAPANNFAARCRPPCQDTNASRRVARRMPETHKLKTRIGRNDPCPCGSEKKYKRCCMAEDERRAAAASPDAEVPSTPRDIHQVTGLLRELAGKGPATKRAEYARLLAETQPLLTYMEREPEIEAAAKAIEPHRPDFLKLANDERAYLKRAHALFAEERFAPLRFTADDVQRAFDKVGQPPHMASDDRFVESVRAAILHLADKTLRSRLAMNLWLHLPDYVAAGRWLDAWVIQHCAFLTSDVPEESNSFLFQMFSPGYDAWAEQQRARDGALLGELGMDLKRLQGMDLDELDAWMQEQMADPARKAQMEALLLANPEQRDMASASLDEMARESTKLLEREDASALLLAPEEIERWLPILNERWAGIAGQLQEISGNAAPDEATNQIIVETILPLFGEMAGHIFTPDRIRQLIAQLKTYRNERFAAGEKKIAVSTLGAITYLEREDDPSRNSFLISLCYASLRRLPKTASGPEAAVEPDCKEFAFAPAAPWTARAGTGVGE